MRLAASNLQPPVAARLLAGASAELGRLRRVRGASRRTVRRMARAAAVMIAAAGLVSTAPAAATTPIFSNPINPFGLAAGGLGSNQDLVDIDGDGDLDAFVGEWDGNTLFFENTGTSVTPAFSAPRTNPFGLNEGGLRNRPEFADIDGDGDFDAFAGEDYGRTIFFENTGTAAAAAFAAARTDPFGLAVVGDDSTPELADIDADGDLDAFIGNSRGDTIFFENTGTSTAAAFAAPRTNPFGLVDVGDYSGPELADIDGDGDIDAFIGNSGGDTIFFENTGSNATPAFAAPQTNPFGLVDVGDASNLKLADIDADGDLDALVGNGADITFFFENTGTNGAAAFAALWARPFGLTAVYSFSNPDLADIDGDGDLDAFVGERHGKTVFSENTGTNTMPAFALFRTNPFVAARVDDSNPDLADIDGDGDLDAFVGDAYGDTVFFENTGTTTTPAFATAQINPFGLANVGGDSSPDLADIDGDGDFDMFVGDAYGDTIFFENSGTTTTPAFAAPRTNAFNLTRVGVEITPELADIDGDGDLDVIVGQRFGRMFLLENTGTGTAAAFAAPRPDPFGLTWVGFSSAPELADIDGDGDLDVLVGLRDRDMLFVENTGTTTAPAFATPLAARFGVAAAGPYSSPKLADIDGDGDLDAIVGNRFGKIQFFKNTGTSAAAAFAVPRANPFDLAEVALDSAPELADIDGDGDLDALLGESSGDTLFFENTGTSTAAAFAPPQTNPFGLANVRAYSSPDLADIDGDGDLDAFIGDSVGNTIFFQNTGTSAAPAFAAPRKNRFRLVSVGSVSSPELADLDGDGDLDALIGNGEGNLLFFENTGTSAVGSFAAPRTNPFGLANVGTHSNPKLVDIDGDGDLDAFIGNSTGETFFFENLAAEPNPTRTPTATPTPTPGTPRSALAADIGPDDQTVVLVDAASFPQSGALWLDGELISYTARSGDTLTGVRRGVAGTARAGHPRGGGAILVASDCAGDCDGDFRVTVDELVRGVAIALGSTPISECLLFDRNGDDRVTVDELVIAVGSALSFCPLPAVPASGSSRGRG